jgi:RecA/RadA recombinase
MATRKRLSGLAKKSGKPSSSGKETKSISLHKDMMKELQARLSSGKNGVVEVLALTDEAVLGRVRGIIPSGSVAIDKATSLGGWPRGRIVEVYGPEHCLAADTFVQYAVRAPDGRKQNSKGGTIADLHRRFHSIRFRGGAMRGTYQRPQTEDSYFTVPSMSATGRIFHNRVVDVLSFGVKPIFRMQTAQGFVLRGTAEHQICVGLGAYASLGDLAAGAQVMVHNNTPFKAPEVKRQVTRSHIHVKAHPVAGVHVVEGRYRYHRLARARALVEAHLNEMTLEEFVDRLNASELDGLVFLPREVHVHHKDEDPTNDVLENLEVVSKAEHRAHHAREAQDNLRFIAVPDEVVSVDPDGDDFVFDIKMAETSNYVANDVVVHNSGKTTVLLQAMAQAQKLGGICGLYDAETKLDIKYAQALGVNTDDVILFQPEEGGSKIEHGVRALRETLDVYNTKTEDFPDDKKPPLLFGWDSLAASGTHVEEARSQEPGVPAREVRSAMRELTTRIARAGASVIILNQVYARIGIPGNVSYGGGGLKFASSIRVDMRRTGRLELPNGAIVGVEGQLSIEKNSLGNFAKTAYAIAYLKGFVDAWTIFEKLQEAKYIQGAGGWQTFSAEGHAPRKWQGGWARLSQMMEEEPPLAELLRSIYLSLP